MNQNSPEVSVADSRDPDSLCAGGKNYLACETAQTFRDLYCGTDPEPNQYGSGQSESRHLEALLFNPLGCVACKHMCEISVELSDGRPNGGGVLKSAEPELHAKMPTTKLMSRILGLEIEKSLIESKKDKITLRPAKNTTPAGTIV